MTTSPPSPRRLRRLLPLGAVTGVALLLAACGSGASKAAPAGSSSGATTPSAASASTAKGADPNAAEVNDPGDIPDNQVFVSYSPPGGGYSVKVPEGWARSQDGSAVTFTDKFNSIRMESKPAPAQPTADSAKNDEVPQIEAANKAVTAAKVTGVTRKAGPAVRITYEADSAPNDVTGTSRRIAVERYEFWRAGNEVVLTLTGAKGADNVDPWKIVTEGFAWAP